MNNITPDEVRQMEINELQTEFKDIHEMCFIIGKCYEFRIRESENRNAIFLERKGDCLFFVTTGYGKIAAVKEETLLYDDYYTKRYGFYEDSQIDGACIMVVDLNLVFDDCIYARELI